MLTAACTKGQPGPHHYDCDWPKDGMVRCVCRNCGEERSYSAAGELLDFGRGRPKEKRGQFDELLKDGKDESSPDPSQKPLRREQMSSPWLVHRQKALEEMIEFCILDIGKGGAAEEACRKWLAEDYRHNDSGFLASVCLGDIMVRANDFYAGWDKCAYGKGRKQAQPRKE